jgi:hypothetical protein
MIGLAAKTQSGMQTYGFAFASWRLGESKS